MLKRIITLFPIAILSVCFFSCADRRKDNINSIGMEFVQIPAGEFMMGKDAEDSVKRHKVIISNPFCIGKYEVTQEQWHEVMGENPSPFRKETVGYSTKNHPVDFVSWYDAIEFCNKLSAREGLTPAYSLSGRETYNSKTRTHRVQWERDANGYRLPTEAEWEYACRAGTTTEYYTGAAESDLASAGWYLGNSEGRPHPIGQKAPNAWGLYDMHGNVEEWCWDCFGAYPDENVTDPDGSAPGKNDCRSRVVRGGSFCMGDASSYPFGYMRRGSIPGHQYCGLRLTRKVGVDQKLKKEAPPKEEATPKKEAPPKEEATPKKEIPLKKEEIPMKEAPLKKEEIPMKTSTNSIGIEFVLIPSGDFIMGTDCKDDPFTSKDECKDLIDAIPSHRVSISELYVGKYEVTQEQWYEVMEYNPSGFKSDDVGHDTRCHPVEHVDWYEAVIFCNKLSEKEGLVPAYMLKVDRRGHKSVRWNKYANGYRLPTEAEWEYACRAGTTTMYNTGDSEPDLARAGWYEFNSKEGTTVNKERTHLVGKKKFNAWSLYDMHGNVQEWCWDWYAKDFYSNSPNDSPAGPTQFISGSTRRISKVCRGGHFADNSLECRSYFRGKGNVDQDLYGGGKTWGIGLRLFRSAKKLSTVEAYICSKAKRNDKGAYFLQPVYEKDSTVIQNSTILNENLFEILINGQLFMDSREEEKNEEIKIIKTLILEVDKLQQRTRWRDIYQKSITKDLLKDAESENPLHKKIATFKRTKHEDNKEQILLESVTDFNGNSTTLDEDTQNALLGNVQEDIMQLLELRQGRWVRVGEAWEIPSEIKERMAEGLPYLLNESESYARLVQVGVSKEPAKFVVEEIVDIIEPCLALIELKMVFNITQMLNFSGSVEGKISREMKVKYDLVHQRPVSLIGNYDISFYGKTQDYQRLTEMKVNQIIQTKTTFLYQKEEAKR